jgi:hypothetical protein
VITLQEGNAAAASGCVDSRHSLKHTRALPMPRKELKNEATPYHQRTLAIMGALGWNVEPNELVLRAKKVLATCAVEFASIVSLVPSYRSGPGSSVDLEFATADGLQKAKRLIRKAAIPVIPSQPHKTVWLDVRKTRDETKPSRLLHRAADYMWEMEHRLQRANPEHVIPSIDKDVQIVNLNSGGAFASSVASCVLVSALTRVAPSWGGAFVQEAAFKRCSLEMNGKSIDVNSTGGQIVARGSVVR